MKEFDFLMKPNLRHFETMMTASGMLQHSRFSRPSLKFGYSIDDNARALIFGVEYLNYYGFDQKILTFSLICLEYVAKAQINDGSFHNFMDKRGKYIDEIGSPDSQGRTLWALAKAQKNKLLANKADYIWSKISPTFVLPPFVKTRAFMLMAFAIKEDFQNTVFFANSLVSDFYNNRRKNWQWYEKILTYSNGIVPLSLLYAFCLTRNGDYLDIAVDSFDFLNRVTYYREFPTPIGQDGWFKIGQRKSFFDQQLIEACDMVLCASKLFEITKDKKYLTVAYDWFGFFWGNNFHKKPLFDFESGGLFDGIKPSGFNKNQGAESVLAYLLAHVEMIRIEKYIACQKKHR